MFKRFLVLAVGGAALLQVHDAKAFTLDGPQIGYESAAFGFGDAVPVSPRQIGDESRVVVPDLYYACDASFLDYFGARGREEVQEIFQLFNDMPPFSSMSDDLSEFPLLTYRENFQASALGLIDIKSMLLANLMREMGLITPERFMWTVRNRNPPQPGPTCPQYDFFIIMRNFDPVTWRPSSYVNGTLYTFDWVFSCPPAADLSYTTPVPIDPNAYSFSAIAQNDAFWALTFGVYYSGLTRDDIGGLRYLYRPGNLNLEGWPTTVTTGTAGGGGVNWGIVGGGEGDTNAVVAPPASIRAGIDKFSFEEEVYDSLLGQLFSPFTNTFSANIYTNGSVVPQTFARAVTQPDFIFAAEDLNVSPTAVTIIQTTRDGEFYSNDAGAGPGNNSVGGGVPVTYTLTKVGEVVSANNPSFLYEPDVTPVIRWGSFDGTTNAPVWYPDGANIRALENQVLGR